MGNRQAMNKVQSANDMTGSMAPSGR
jgi:hypothetical protein